MPPVDTAQNRPVQRRAVEVFLNGACVRTPSEERREEGHDKYKKGWEIRFSVRSRAEATEVRRTLDAAGLQPGRPYRKHKTTWIVPMYGRDQVTRFLGWVEAADRR